MKPTGILYGVGVGPGDPELLTLKAARILASADVLLAASSTKNDSSLALSIAAPHLRPGVRIVTLGFPMTRDPEGLAAAWEANADQTLAVLDQGHNAAFLTLGDPMTYSTFGYLLRTLKARRPKLAVEVVPGVTSYQAAAARLLTPLAESGENLALISGVADEAQIRGLLSACDNAVILKAYRSLPRIRRILDDLDLTGRARFATRLGLPGEAVHDDLGEAPDDPNYFSLILVKKG